MTGSDRRILAAILAVALALRVGVALAWEAPLSGDAGDYDRLASGLADGRGYVDTNGRPTAWRPPLYPAFLAGVYRTVGSSSAAVGLTQAVVGTLTVAAAFAAAALALGMPAGLIAAGLVAVDAAQLALTSRRLSEGLFTLLLLLLVLGSLRLRDRLRSGETPWVAAAVLGALGAAATLTRGLFVGYPLVLAAALVALRDGPSDKAARRRAGVAAAVLVLAYGLALVPWTLRNVRAVGAPTPVATQGGLTLYSSWFPPGSVFGVFPDDEVTRSAVGLSEVEQNAHFTRATTRGLVADPARVPRLLVLKMLYLGVPLDWEVLPAYGSVNPTYLVAAGWAAAFLLALGRGRRRAAWPLWLPIAYLVVMTLVFYGSPRMRAPVDPLLAALGAGALAELARRRGAAAAGGALAASAAGVGAIALGAGPLKLALMGALRSVGLWRS